MCYENPVLVGSLKEMVIISSTWPEVDLADVDRGVAPVIVSHYNTQPVFDVFANVDRRDLGTVGSAVDKIMHSYDGKLPRGMTLDLRGQGTLDSLQALLLKALLFVVLARERFDHVNRRQHLTGNRGNLSFLLPHVMTARAGRMPAFLWRGRPARRLLSESYH